MARTKLYCSPGTYRGFSLNLPDEHQSRTRQPAPLSPNSSGFWWRGRDGCGVSGYGFGAWGTARDRYESEASGGDGAGLCGRRDAFACRIGAVTVPAGAAAVVAIPAAPAAIAVAGGLDVAVPGSAATVHLPSGAAAVGIS